MRIIFLGTRGFPNIQGGVERHCEGLAVNLVKLGCDVLVFTRKPYVEKDVKEFKGVKLLALPAIRHKAIEAPLHTLLGVLIAPRYKPDILHIQAIGPALFVPLARMLGMKVVITSHGANYKHLKWGRFAKLIFRLGEFFGVKFANDGIAISEAIARDIEKKHQRKLHVIPNGLDMPAISLSENVLHKYDLIKGRYLLAVGRFVPEKGFHDLIEAFKHLPIKDYKLVIVGQSDHPDRYSLDLEKKASRNKNIILTGFLSGNSLQELYSHAALFVLPSYYEGLPIVLLEAMGYGLSCIVSDIPANRSIGLLRDDRFFSPGSVKGLMKKISEFIDSPLTDKEKKIQIDQIAKRYNWGRIAKITLEVYKSVLNVQQ